MDVRSTNKVLPHMFDIRNIIGALLAIYGVLLTIAGFVPAVLRNHDNPAAAGNRTDLYIGTDANWWVGLVLLGVAFGFFAWAFLRPVRADETGSPGPDSHQSATD
jgi:H+/Cl- antiporter ClcA